MSDQPMEKVIRSFSDMSRRDLLRLSGPLTLAGIAGCMGGSQTNSNSNSNSNSSNNSKSSNRTTDTKTQNQPQQGGTLQVGLKVGVETMDGRSVSGTQSRQIFDNIYSKILRLRPSKNGIKIIGDLAMKWGWEGKEKTKLVVHLNKKATFQNGEPVTANDVVYTFKTLLNKSIYNGSNYYPDRLSTSARDKHTVVFNTGDKPLASLEVVLTHTPGIINKKADEKNNMSKNPIGSGPFTFEEWVEGDHVYVKGWNDYWKTTENGTQLPYLDQIKFKIFPDVDTKRRNLEQGELDFIDVVPPKDVKSMQNKNSIVTQSTGLGSIAGVVSFNTTKPPFNNPKVRQAFVYAVDWKSVMKVAYFGTTKRANNYPMPTNSKWALSNLVDPYKKQDVKKAKQLLKEAGVNPSSISFTNPLTKGYPNRLAMQQAIQAQLKANLGISYEINKMDGTTAFDRWENNEFGFSIVDFTNYPDPDLILTAFMGNGFFNFGGFKNDKIITLLEEARQTTNEEKRMKKYKKVAELNNKLVGNYWAFWGETVAAYQPYVKNFNWHHIYPRYMWFERVWLANKT